MFFLLYGKIFTPGLKNSQLSFLFNLFADPDPEMGRFVESKFGNTLLLDKAGYVYLVKNKMKKNAKIHWACREFKKEKCYAKATTEGIYVTKWQGEHNHPVRPAQLQNYGRKYGIK